MFFFLFVFDKTNFADSPINDFAVLNFFQWNKISNTSNGSPDYVVAFVAVVNVLIKNVVSIQGVS